jgi:anthranilate phosphoribosyltransferase
LTREEAREAFSLILRDEVDPHQVGAFLMLLRFRGEDPEEITGIVEAARDVAGLGKTGAASRGTSVGRPEVALDWPSYGSGRTRGAPWFLLAALALARSGIRVLMHGSNEFSGGISVGEGLAALGIVPCDSLLDAERALDASCFAYLPLEQMAPPLDRLLQLRHLFGLRSPVNTAARLLNPADAPAGVDGVFHPPYIEVHLGVAERMGRTRLLVLKGGGGEAERVPLKTAVAHLWDGTHGRSEITLDRVAGLQPATPIQETAELLAAVWRAEEAPPTAIATVVATITLGLLALGKATTPEQAEQDAHIVWLARR